MDTQLIADWLTDIQAHAENCKIPTAIAQVVMQWNLERICKLALKIGDEAGIKVRI